MNLENNEEKLIESLRVLCEKGPIPSISTGANSIGKTLQSELNINHSTTSRNSFLGFTINSTRASNASNARTNLFSSVPNWRDSLITSSTEMVKKYGRVDETGKYARSLFCTVTALNKNSFGLKLKSDSSSQSLHECFIHDDNENFLVSWDISALQNKLNKLDKTAIVTALPVKTSSGTAFHYRYLEILKQPSFKNFLELIEDGVITVDHCISLEHGKKTAREQGPLFKIRADSRSLLFESLAKIDLLSL